jgi:hypothetical protein
VAIAFLEMAIVFLEIAIAFLEIAIAFLEIAITFLEIAIAFLEIAIAFCWNGPGTGPGGRKFTAVSSKSAIVSRHSLEVRHQAYELLYSHLELSLRVTPG